MQTKCLYCGNNPVSHVSFRLTEIFSGCFFPFTHILLKSPFGKVLDRGISYFGICILWFLEKIGKLEYLDAPHEKTSARGRVLWEEAQRRGVKMQGIKLFGIVTDNFRVELARKKAYFTGLLRPATTPRQTENWMDDKWRLKQELLAGKIPVARGGCSTRFRPLLKVFETLEKPVIIKPRFGSRGRHTTTYIHTVADLKRAFTISKQLCRWVVMEEHLVGSVYRGTVIGGKVAGVLAGDPPRITGDGVHTIAELVTIKNAQKHPLIHNIQITPLTTEFLARSGLTAKSVLSAGKTIDLSEKIGVAYGGSAREVTEQTHPKIVGYLEKAAAVLQDPILGFDFIIENIDRDPDEQKWGIIECNSVPFLNLHYDPVEGETNNVAKDFWDYVEKNVEQFV